MISTEHLILPTIRRREPAKAQLVSLALNRDLNVHLSTSGELLSYEELGKESLSLHAAWELAAQNFLRLSHQEIRSEPIIFDPGGASSPDGWVLSSPQVEVASWLAHPRCFHLLEHTLIRRTGCQELAYLLASPHRLYAIPREKLPLWSELIMVSRWLSPVPLIYEHGFPKALFSLAHAA